MFHRNDEKLVDQCLRTGFITMLPALLGILPAGTKRVCLSIACFSCVVVSAPGANHDWSPPWDKKVGKAQEVEGRPLERAQLRDGNSSDLQKCRLYSLT